MVTECVPAEDSKVEWLGRMLIALLIGLLPALANVVPLCISMHVLTTAPPPPHRWCHRRSYARSSG